MKRLFKYLPNEKFLFEPHRDVSEDQIRESKKEVKGYLYLLPNLKSHTTDGLFHTNLIGDRLRQEEVDELKEKHTFRPDK